MNSIIDSNKSIFSRNFFRINLSFFFIVLFAFWMPINERISTITILIVVLTSIFNYKQFSKKYINRVFWIVLLYIVYVWAYLKNNDVVNANVFESKATLIAFPLIFALNKIDANRFYKICLAFILGCLISFALSFFSEIGEMIIKIKYDLINSTKPLWLNIKNEFQKRSESVSYINPTGRSYLANYSVFAISMVIFFFKDLKRNLSILLFSLLIVALYNISSISSFFSLIFVLFYAIVFRVKSRLKYPLIILSIFLPLIMFYFSGRFEEYYKESKEIVQNEDINNHFFNERVAFWKSAFVVAKRHNFMGAGMKKANEEFNEDISRRLNWSMEWINMNNYNAHNQYLQFLMESGFIGLFVFISSIFWFLIVMFKKSKEFIFLGVCFVTIILVHMLTESVFGRYLGISFFSFFYSLLMRVKFN